MGWFKNATKWVGGNLVWDGIKSVSGLAFALLLGLLGWVGDQPNWLIALLAVVGLVAGIWIVNGVLYLTDRQKTKRLTEAAPEESIGLPNEIDHLIPVVGKTFRNEEVVMDGYSYAHCTFDNVTFVIGGKPFHMVGNTVHNDHGQMSIRLTHDRLTTFAIFLQSFGLLAEGAVVGDRESGRTFLTPLKVEPPTSDDSGGD